MRLCKTRGTCASYSRAKGQLIDELFDNYLDRIVARKRQEVAVRSAQRALEELYELLTDQAPVRGFSRRLVAQVEAQKARGNC